MIQLDKIGMAAIIRYNADAAFPIGQAPSTPELNCCAQNFAGKRKCEPDPAQFATPVWRALDFQLDAPHYYQYAYESADGQSFTATATGDLDCDGVTVTYVLRGDIENGIPRTRLVEPPPKVPAHDLVHGCEVVGTDNRFHLELAILRASWPAIVEPHARSDRVGALGRRDVEADERSRDPLQPELSPELINWVRRALIAFESRELELLEQVPRVLLCEVDELASRPALWRHDARALRRLLDRLTVLEVERNE